MRKTLRNTIFILVIIQLILWIDGIPLKYVLGSITCHLFFTSLLQDFPFVEPISFSTIGSCVAVILQHYIWFDYFGKHTVSSNINLTLMSLIGFFMVFIWILPAGFFISLTFADETLPGTIGVGNRTGSPEFNGAFVQQQSSSKKKSSVFKRAADSFLTRKDDVIYTVAPGVGKQY
jgi:hypothetical protein